MKVQVIAHTPDPEEIVAAAARLCYSPKGATELLENFSPDQVEKFVKKLVSLGHESPMEHVSFTFAIEGISRACSHQLVRHRVGASYSQKSQRYVKENQFDLTVSGHTHGGQIYPFHYIVKSANDFLAGMYQVNNNSLYITRGAGYWGPPMRIFAPSDITVFNFKRKENEK